jgi:hypothetical protein
LGKVVIAMAGNNDWSAVFIGVGRRTLIGGEVSPRIGELERRMRPVLFAVDGLDALQLGSPKPKRAPKLNE